MLESVSATYQRLLSSGLLRPVVSMSGIRVSRPDNLSHLRLGFPRVSHLDELTFASNDGVDGPRHGLLRNGVDLRPFHLAASDSGFSARAAAIRSRKCMNGMG